MMRLLSVLLMRNKLIKPHSALMCAQENDDEKREFLILKQLKCFTGIDKINTPVICCFLTVQSHVNLGIHFQGL